MIPDAINNWMGLAELIQNTAGEKWIFRGEPSSSYTLRPKAGRVGKERGSPRKKPYDPAHEREALGLFKQRARQYIGHTPSSDLEWLAIAQHHGMPTRLLDWTESLLVAAYFATVEAGTRGNAVIYGLSGFRPVTKEDEKRPFDLTNPGVYRPPHIVPRLPAQRSAFTVHPDPTTEFLPPDLFRWVVKKDTCVPIKRILDACGINESSLFPDLDSLSRYIAWRYKWGKL